MSLLCLHVHVVCQRVEALLFCADGAGQNLPVRKNYRKISSKRQFLRILVLAYALDCESLHSSSVIIKVLKLLLLLCV